MSSDQTFREEFREEFQKVYAKEKELLTFEVDIEATNAFRKKHNARQLELKQETDPNGIDQHAPGAKLDAGKPMVGLVLGDFSQALNEVARVGTIGAQKYSKHGWKKVDDGFNRYTDAMLRHWLDEAGGETFDKDTGMLHAAQVAWNALARLELLIKDLKDEG